jgi:hypothetical protein
VKWNIRVMRRTKKNGLFAGQLAQRRTGRRGYFTHQYHRPQKSRDTFEEQRRIQPKYFREQPDCVKILNLDGTLHSMNVNGLCIMEIDDFDYFAGLVWVDFGKARKI